MILYLDMDGVLMDFDQAVADAGITNDGYYHKPISEWTPLQHGLHARIIALLNQRSFWPSVKPMADAHVLWGWCRPMHPHILTAVLKEAVDPAWVIECKQQSILQLDPVFPLATNFTACLRAEKANLAGPGAILVDDNPGNCAEWTERGGTAILHKDAMTTIKILRELGYAE